MKKIAIPVSNGNTALQFENSSQFLIYDLSASDSLVTGRHFESGANNHPEKVPKMLADQGVDVVLTRWIRKDIAKTLCDNKIHVFVGVPIEEPDMLVEDYLDGDLVTDNRMCY